ncbi:hypothetical protein GCM10010411_49990 [Actinomadura fulvescens]|uniref:Uncharacterized protein n=2 Tax=Actinomadura fulvescens TaxID=46160 RepID=A0ABP6CAN4_9ACTN
MTDGDRYTEIIGAMAWKHPNGSAMLIEFMYSKRSDERRPYLMMRELIGTDGVGRRGGTAWRDIEAARAEWSAMCERYAARGWKRVPVPPDGDLSAVWASGTCTGCGAAITGRRAKRGTCLECGGPFH